MSYKGYLRIASASYNRAERAKRKRLNEFNREQARLEKLQELENAIYEVELFESEMESLLSIHKELTLNVDWNFVLSSPVPNEPTNSKEKEKIAETEFKNYKPGVIDKLLKKTESKKEALIHEIEKAKIIDEQNYQDALIQYETDLEDWKISVDLAEKILKKDQESYLEAITFFDPFSDIYNFGKKLEFSINSEILQADVLLHDEKVIPSESKSVLKSGKLSIKKISLSRQNELYQDHVCSVVLRIAREIFSLLPIEFLIINAIGSILNTQTGYKEEKPILSIAITRPILESLNFENIDPSDSVNNFVHKMDFKSIKGFLSIQPLTSEEFDAFAVVLE